MVLGQAQGQIYLYLLPEIFLSLSLRSLCRETASFYTNTNTNTHSNSAVSVSIKFPGSVIRKEFPNHWH